MTRKTNLRSAAFILTSALLLSSFSACSKEEPSETSVETAANPAAYNTEYVRIVDGTSTDMMTADYWLDEDDEKILMDEAAIADFNSKNMIHVQSNDGTELPFLYDIPEKLDGEYLRHFLGSIGIPEDPSAFYLNKVPTTKEYWESLRENTNYDAIPDVINVRFGYSVQRTTLRLYPTDDRVFDSTDDLYFDCMLFAECLPYMPVVVLHESTDGEWYYVVFDNFAAWVRKEAIAICPGREDWLARQNNKDWLTVTAREIRLGDDPYVEANRDLVLPMGTHMQLVKAENAPAVINQRTTYGNYVVKVPTRGITGYVQDEYVLIPVSDDVTVGMLPYSSANVVRQAFKLLGDRYGWGGDLRANDCSGIVREIFNCFGFRLPRVSQTDVEGIYKVDMSEMSSDDKLAELKKMEPGSLLSFPGHIMIYLGMKDDVPYVISAVGSFVAPEPGSEEVLHPDSVVVNSLFVRRASLVTWLEAIQTAVTIK
ncbi:MAG: SH3 domain-containing protein [Clostridiales bacterium]|nr:SH3 domain-containing protein [Clostridiales bacterium]